MHNLWMFGEDKTLKYWSILWKIHKKNTIKLRGIPLAVTSGILSYQYWIKWNNQRKFGGDTTIQTWMVVNYVWKYSKNVIKSKGIP